jgi:CheY-like chemotaxis protein
MLLFKKKISVLLADDDPADHSLMRKALNNAPVDLNIHSVYNGMQLLDFLIKSEKSKELISGKVPDIIITDIYMPFIGGIHVLKQIRKHDQLKSIPIYVFSSNYDMNVRSKVMENGAIEFHRKPDEFDELQIIINRILVKTTPDID